MSMLLDGSLRLFQLIFNLKHKKDIMNDKLNEWIIELMDGENKKNVTKKAESKLSSAHQIIHAMCIVFTAHCDKMFRNLQRMSKDTWCLKFLMSGLPCRAVWISALSSLAQHWSFVYGWQLVIFLYIAN